MLYRVNGDSLEYYRRSMDISFFVTSAVIMEIHLIIFRPKKRHHTKWSPEKSVGNERP